MFKKSLIGLIVVALAGGGYWYYDDYQKKEKVRLLKERNEDIARMIEKKMADNIQKAKERKERELQEAIEEARQKRIADGNPIIEEIITYYPDSEQKKEQYTLVEGKKEGLEIQWQKSGKKYREVYYKNGKLHGKYWSTTSLVTIEEYYNDGKEHGVFKKWAGYKYPNHEGDPNKLIEELFFQNGKIEGEAFVYEQNINYKYFFENNVIKRVDAVFLTGAKALEILPHPTKPHHWSVTKWYKNGQVSHEGFLVLISFRKIGNKTDHNIFYRKNGLKFLELEMSHDRSDGLCRRWDENGKLITELFSGRNGIDKSKPHFGVMRIVC